MADGRTAHIDLMQTTYRYRQIQFGRLGWRGRITLAVALTLGVAFVAAIAVLSLAFAVILLPVVALGAIVAGWRLRRPGRPVAPGERKDGAGRVIETDYVVIGRPGEGR